MSITATTRKARRSPLETLSKVSALLELLETDSSLELAECEFCSLPVARTYSDSSRALVDSAGLRAITTSLVGATRAETISDRLSKGSSSSSSFVAGLAGAATICHGCAPRAERFRSGDFRPLNPSLPVMSVSSSSTSSDSRLEFRDLAAAVKYARAEKGPAPRKARKAKVSSSPAADKCSSSRGSGVVRAADARAIATAALEVLGLEMPETAAGVPEILETLETEKVAAAIIARETGAADPHGSR